MFVLSDWLDIGDNLLINQIMQSFFNLPVRIWKLNIVPFLLLKYFPTLDSAVTNKMFREKYLNILRGFALQQKLTVRGGTVNMLQWFEHRKIVVSGLEMRGCVEIVDAALACFVNESPSLKTLEVTPHFDFPFSLDNFTNSLRNDKPNLLERMAADEVSIIDIGVITNLANRCPQLTSLSLNAINSVVTDAEVNSLTVLCPSITKISLLRFALLTCDALTSMASSWTTLLELNVPGSRVSDRGVIAVVDACSLLEHLNICNCLEVTDASTQAACARCKSLRALHVSGCAALTGLAFDTVHSACPLRRLVATGADLATACIKVVAVLGARLQALSCSEPSASFITAAATHTHLGLSELTIYGDSLLQFSEWICLSVLCPCLEKLVVSHSEIFDDAVVRSFHGHCPRLHTIVARFCALVNKELQAEIPALQWK